MILKRDFLTFLLFVALAAMIWYGHAMHSVRNTIVPVLIQYTGKPGTIGLEGDGLPSSVMIEIRDAGARLNTYHKDPLRLTIDLHPYIHGSKGTIHIPSDALRRSISDLLQGTSSLIEANPDEIICPYFTEQEKTVCVAFAGEMTTANEYQIVEKPLISPQKIKIYGQDKILDKIDTLFTVPTHLEDLSDTTNLRIALAMPKGIRSDIDSLSMRIIAERFTEKKMLVPVHVIGAPEGYTIRLFPDQVEVNVRVGISHFAQVNASDIRAVCTYLPERKDKLDVEIRYSTPYITAAWAFPGVVEFLLLEQ